MKVNGFKLPIESEEEYSRFCREVCGWTDADGPLPGVWSRKPVGFQSLTSCRWTDGASGVMILPHYLLPNNAAWPSPYLEYEAHDIGCKTGDLWRARQFYQEYNWPYAEEKGRTMVLATRQNWPRPIWYRREQAARAGTASK